jgi:hypothetical protein
MDLAATTVEALTSRLRKIGGQLRGSERPAESAAATGHTLDDVDKLSSSCHDDNFAATNVANRL